MTDLTEIANGSVEDRSASGFNSIIAVLVAIAATFVALGNVKDGNIVQAMSQAQANAVDQWSYFQAKGMKLNLAEAMVDQLELQRELLPNAQSAGILDRKIASYRIQIKTYQKEKADIRKQAEDYQKQYDELNFHDDQFDMSEACLTVAIAVFGVTALTRKRWLLAFASIFMFFGILLGLAGFFGWKIHPDVLAHFLS